MKNYTTPRILSFAIIGGLAATAVAQPAFYLMGNTKPGAFSQVWGLSRDGTFAVGNHSGADAPFTWTPGGGRQDVLGQYFSYRGVSRDGTTMTGYGSADGKTLELLRQRPGEAPEFLGIPNGYGGALGFAASAHGDSIVGFARRPGNDERSAPFRWTQSGGFQVLAGPDLSDFSRAYDVSDDGKTIVGNAQSLFGGEIGGFVWREGVGESLLPGSEFAEGISANGRFIAGTGNLGTGGGAMLWTDGVPKYLGSIPGWGSEASDVSDDGNVVVGRLRNNNHADSFVWTPGTGMMMAKDYFQLNGVPLPSGLLGIQAYSLSGDGRTFGGTLAATSVPQGGGGFVAMVPAPSILSCLTVCVIMPLTRRKR